MRKEFNEPSVLHTARMPASASTSKLLCGEPTSAMLSLFIMDDITRQSEGIGTKSLRDNIFGQFDAAIILDADVVQVVGNVFMVTLATAKKHVQSKISLAGPKMPRPRTCCSGRHRCPKRDGASFDGMRRSEGNSTARRCCIRL